MKCVLTKRFETNTQKPKDFAQLLTQETVVICMIVIQNVCISRSGIFRFEGLGCNPWLRK